jgi:hypothetical protein
VLSSKGVYSIIFLFTQNLVKALHRAKKKLALFMKLDIAKAFDSVRWDFL